MEKIGIIGLGYVGLPLAAELGKFVDVIGFDINKERIEELKKGHDRTREVEAHELKSSTRLHFFFRPTGYQKRQLFHRNRSHAR